MLKFDTIKPGSPLGQFYADAGGGGLASPCWFWRLPADALSLDYPRHPKGVRRIYLRHDSALGRPGGRLWHPSGRFLPLWKNFVIVVLLRRSGQKNPRNKHCGAWGQMCNVGAWHPQARDICKRKTQIIRLSDLIKPSNNRIYSCFVPEAWRII